MSIFEEMKEQLNCISRQSYTVSEHRDLQATAMSVDWTGEWVLLAGRRHLALKRIGHDEDDSLKKYHRNSKYDVSAAEWAICQNSQEYCAIATSQLIEVVTWSSGDPTLIHSLRAHTRMVTDIDWHSKEPHLLASCSIDTFTHLWDLRDPRKPILSLSAVCMSGATQVGFNRVSGNLLATAHDGDLRIWDIRKGSCPIQYITAHLSRIHGINWSHRHETYLTTASQDGTVKYFDVNNSRRAEKIITTSSPVWRARYTPVGNGLITIVVPHLGRGENSLLLWNNSKQTDPVCSFEDHTDVILDFAWRPNRDDSPGDMELITWSRDQTLRLWRIDEPLLRLCDPPQPDVDDEDMHADSWSISKSVGNDSFGKSINEQPSCSLQHEFSLLNTNIPHIDIDVLDPVKRHAIIKISANGYIILLQVNFPNDYPSPNVSPEFIFCERSSIDDNLSISLLKILKTCALQRVKKGRTCTEQCLRALVTALKRSTGGGDKTQLRLQSPRLEGALSGALHDACIPFPRTSGAKFNTTGLFVTFSQPLNTKRISLRRQNTTPRALSAISGGYLGNVMGSQPVLYAHRDTSTSTFYIQDRHRKNSRNRPSQKTSSSAVIHVYDITKLLNINKNLAEDYILDKTDILRTCRHNTRVAENSERPELMQVWNLAEMIATPSKPEDTACDYLFQHNPFKRSLLDSLITHFAKNGDVQTAVMLCCTFDKYCSESETMQSSSSNNKSSKRSPTNSPYHTIVPVDLSNHNTWSLAMQLKQFRSNSWSDSLDWVDLKQLNNEICRPFLRKSQKHLFDSFKKVYAEILFGWRLLAVRAVILKHLSYSSEVIKSVEFVTECIFCKLVNRTSSCTTCHKALLYCIICRLPVKGAANACLLCGHGGHTQHLETWFQTHDVCALGCGCRCLQECRNVLNEKP